MKEKIREKDVVTFTVGLILGILVMLLFYPDRIVELKNGEQVAIEIGDNKITADDMFIGLKEKYSINELIEIIDKTILEGKYDLNEDDYKSIDEMAKNYIEYYESLYQMSEEDFLKGNGFESLEEFKKYLELDYMRNEYYLDDLKDEEVEDYYNNKVFSPVKVEHILVKITSDLKDEDAKSKATEILNKYKSGVSWEEVKTQYKNDIVTESFNVEFDSSLEEAFSKAALGMEDDSVSTDLVKTSYGYHIINRLGTEEKPSLESINDRVRTAILNERVAEDKNYYQKTLIKMREDAKVDIKDTELKKVYEKYLKQYE